jgi:hypothetical protein
MMQDVGFDLEERSLMLWPAQNPEGAGGGTGVGVVEIYALD